MFVIFVLAAYNISVNELLARPYHWIAAVATGSFLVAAASSRGISRAEMGLERRDLRRGVRYGLGAATVAVVVIAGIAVIPATRTQFDNPDFESIELPLVLWEVLVRIPALTAGFEELAFRGVLLAVLVGRFVAKVAVGIQSVLFGLWHILPTVGPGVTSTDVVVAVVFTTAAGVLFGVLRRRSGSLVAPLILHAAVNSTTFLAAWIVTTHSP